MIAKTSSEERWLFAEGDTRQDKELSKEHEDVVKSLHGKLDSLIKLADYSLEKGL